HRFHLTVDHAFCQFLGVHRHHQLVRLGEHRSARGGGHRLRSHGGRNGGSQCRSDKKMLDHAATFPAFAFTFRNSCMRSLTSRPSRTAHTTRLAPRTMSPAANTPSRLVIIVLWSTRTVPQRVT